MRRTKGGIIHMANVIAGDLEDRSTGLSKPQRIGLADLAASVLGARSVNTSEIASILPRDVKGDEERYRYINRWLSNEKIDPIGIIRGFISDILKTMYSDQQTAILMMDQTKISNGFECLMVSVRAGDRALPICWRVIDTQGPINYAVQHDLLGKVAEMIPLGMQVLLTADRFYGTQNLIRYCQDFGWQYRIRLKSNLILHHGGGELLTGDLVVSETASVENRLLSK